MSIRTMRCWSLALLATSSSLSAAGFDAKLYAQCLAYVQQDSVPEKAVKRCQPLANSDHPGALYAYGLILWNTKSGKAEEALTVLRKAAEQDHPPARYFLAKIYQANNVTQATPSLEDHARSAYCAGYPEAQEFKTLLATAGSGEVACEEVTRSRFDGPWTGDLSFWSAPQEKPADGEPFKFRLSILADGTAKSQQWEGGTWVDLKTLRAQEVDGILTLQSTEAGWDFDGKWVEHWSIQMLRIDDSRARVHWTRTVSNLHLPTDNPDKSFVMAAGGEFRRE